MFSRSSGLVFLAISLCVQAVPSLKLYRQNRHHPATGSATVVNHTSTAASASPTVLAVVAGDNKASGNINAAAQTSLTLDPAVIAPGFAQNGSVDPSDPGQVASLTSTNNFINFCLLNPNFQLTNGKQITNGSCNPAPMGLIPSSVNMPSAKFVSPTNLDTIPANQNFTIQLAIKGLETGNFANAETNYFAAPQQLNTQGQIIGHSHVVVEQLQSLTQTTPLDPTKFVFFKGLNAAADNGILDATVSGGLPAGFYKLSSINTAANHQPVLVPIAQHGSLDDVVYFTVSSDGTAAGNGGQSKSSAAPKASSTASSGKSNDSPQNSKPSTVPSDATASPPTSTSAPDSSVPCQ